MMEFRNHMFTFVSADRDNSWGEGKGRNVAMTSTVTVGRVQVTTTCLGWDINTFMILLHWEKVCLCHLGIHFFAETEFLGQFLCEMRRRCDSADFTTGSKSFPWRNVLNSTKKDTVYDWLTSLHSYSDQSWLLLYAISSASKMADEMIQKQQTQRNLSILAAIWSRTKDSDGKEQTWGIQCIQR